ncbi:MFS transporter [Stieleria sp. JC731]|uniref:MDR family MFS transporter n=1 Tax=Pirellulaceae TaxID=2691357 RepID=UPI001E3E794E|nr:MFS transporter [Stieleria sp. JC731]MCC9598931.1 MFS transporter [Stieleria sp. JC731]
MLGDYFRLPLPVRILCFGSFVNRAGSFAVIFLSIYASEQLGFGIPFATLCIGMLGLGSMVGSIVGGFLSDHIGRKPVMLLALFGGGLLLILLGSIQHKLPFALCVCGFALVSDLYRPAASALIADFSPIDRRTHAFALMYISVNLGFAIAPPLGGILAGYSFKLLFWLDAITMCAYGVIIWFWIDEKAARPESTDDANPIRRGNLRESITAIIGDTPFLMFCLSTLLVELVFVQGFATLPLYIRQSGFSNVQFGLLMSINGILIVLLQLPLTHWFNRFNAMNIVTIGAALIAIGFGTTGFGGSFLLIGISIGVWTLGEILQAPTKQSIIAKLAPEHCRGAYMGLFTTCYAIALAIGAPLGGEVLQRLGPMTLWLASGSLSAIAVVIYLAIHPIVTRRVMA